jgi:hypothetical protein
MDLTKMGPKKLAKFIAQQDDKIRGLEAQVAELSESLTNQNLAYVIAKRELGELREWTQLNKPHVLALLAATERHNVLVAAAATQRAQELKLPKRSTFEGRRSPHVKARNPLIPTPRRDGTLSKKPRSKKL